VLGELSDARDRLLSLLRDLAFQQRPVTLASGRKSHFYVDSKQVTLDPHGHVFIGHLLFEAIRAYEERSGIPVAGAGGLTLGADPLASAVAMTSALRGHPIAAFLVRKEPKGHGTGAWLEGTSRLAPGSELVVLEDVVTTGASALSAVDRVIAAGFEVRLLLGLVDRLEGGRDAIEARGLQLETLFTRRDFLSDEEAEG
jgi:orotate phosphoribosyltransferase